jgi:hypothetical protein
MAILDLANLNHQVNQVLYAEYSIVGDRVLLVYGFDKEPELINDLYIVGIDPVVAAHHETEEELLLQLLGLTYVEPNVGEVLDGLTVHCGVRQLRQEVEQYREEVLVLCFERHERTRGQD